MSGASKAREVVGMLVEGAGLFRARLETRNFTFEAYGATEKAATDTLINGLITHAQEYNLKPMWFQPFREDLEVVQLQMGIAYRDEQEMPPPQRSVIR